MIRFYLSIFSYLFFIGFIHAENDAIYIGKIIIQGNQKTKDEIILRELLFKVGDKVAVSVFSNRVEESEELILNTGLFNEAEITIEDQERNNVLVRISVTEAWYIYPVPIFELIDRNFNVWWVEQNRSLQRINFGLEFAHLNFTGQKDKLKLTAKYGYTRSYTLKYSLPFINKSQTIGIISDISLARNREINYNSIDNKQLFYRALDNRFIYQRFWADIGLVYRPAFRVSHTLRLRFQQNYIDEVIAKDLNPDFFLDGRKLQRTTSINYIFLSDHRDVSAYPLKGNMLEIRIRKDGLGLFKDRNALTMEIGYDKFWSISDRWSTALLFSSKLNLVRQQQPFNENRAFGFGRNNIYGYEFYVINGLDLGIVKSFLRLLIIKNKIQFGKIIPIKAYRKMPFKMYLTLNQGIGAVNAPYTRNLNPLSNRFLWGGGIGLDIVLFYDKVLRFQYSYNHLLEHGLFLRFDANI